MSIHFLPSVRRDILNLLFIKTFGPLSFWNKAQPVSCRSNIHTSLLPLLKTGRAGIPNGKPFSAPHNSFVKRCLRRFHSRVVDSQSIASIHLATSPLTICDGFWSNILSQEVLWFGSILLTIILSHIKHLSLCSWPFGFWTFIISDVFHHASVQFAYPTRL